MEATQATAAFASAASRFRAGDPRRGWAAFGAGTEARAGVILRFCPEPRREIVLAKTTLHLALARRGQGMPSDRACLAAALVEAAHATRPEPMTAILADFLRRADGPGESLDALAAKAAGADVPAPQARRGARTRDDARG